jgi:acetylornithine/N-succinyldiaminopimelate aminotransferase
MEMDSKADSSMRLPMTVTESLVEAGKTFLYPNYRQPPLVLVRGNGVDIWDTDGRHYLDFYAGIAVNVLGHGHPALARAISEQAAKLIHVSNYFFNEPNVQLAERLCGLAHMDRALFCNSGAEAIEAMLKLARRHFFEQGERERYHVIAFERSFHGRTLGALAATGQAGYRDGFGPLPGVIHVPYGDVASVKAKLDERVCAVLVEPIQGEGGVLPAPPGFLEQLREITTERGALLLVDEIQTGVGRTGRFLACEHSNIDPDAIALAKALAGGVPIGAMLCREHLAGALPPGSHGSTFGGNPLASAAALAVLETLEKDQLIAGATSKGQIMAEGLRELERRHPKSVRGSRGIGLMQALVLDEGLDARALLAKIREKGVLLTLAGGSALRLTPPLVITPEEIQSGLRIIDAALGEF